MEHRNYIRQSVDFPALISGNGFESQLCRVQDFCLGGMLLRLDSTQGLQTAASLLKKGDSLKVHVEVTSRAGVQAAVLEAEVARVVSHGVGIRFIEPDATQLLALQNYARQCAGSSAQNVTRKQHFTFEQKQSVLQQIQAVTEQFVHRGMAVFVPAAASVLRDAAEADASATGYAEAADVLERSAADLSRHFLRNVTTPLLAFLQGSVDVLSTDASANESVSLADKAEFEGWLQLRVMATKAEGALTEQLLPVKLRFDELLGVALSVRNTPLHPAIFCNAFGKSIKLLPFKSKIDRLLLQVFEQQVLTELDAFYRQVNQLFIRENVLPDLNLGQYLRDPASEPVPVDDVEPPLLQEAVDAAVEERSAPLQQSQQAASAAHWKEHLEQRFNYLTGRLKDYPGLSVPLLSRLEALRPALLQSLGTKDKEDEAGILLRQILDDLCFLDQSLGRSGQDLTQVLDDFCSRKTINNSELSDFVNKLRDMCSRQLDTVARSKDRLVEQAVGQYKIDQAKARVAQALESRLGGKTVPKAVLSVLDAGWRALLVQTLLREGDDSRHWEIYLAAIEQLVYALDFPPSGERLNALLASIKQGLARIDETQTFNERLLADLRGLLSAQSRKVTPPPVVKVPKGALMSGVGGSVLGAFTEEQKKQIEAIQPGDVFLWATAADANIQVPVELVWKAQDDGRFVFVDPVGRRVRACDPDELMDDLEHGRLVLAGRAVKGRPITYLYEEQALSTPTP